MNAAGAFGANVNECAKPLYANNLAGEDRARLDLVPAQIGWRNHGQVEAAFFTVDAHDPDVDFLALLDHILDIADTLGA